MRVSQVLIHISEFVKHFWRHTKSPRDYCHRQPQYYRITVRQSVSWCCADNYSAAWSSVEKLHQRKNLSPSDAANREVLADNVLIPRKVITAGLRGGLTGPYQKVPVLTDWQHGWDLLHDDSCHRHTEINCFLKTEHVVLDLKAEL